MKVDFRRLTHKRRPAADHASHRKVGDDARDRAEWIAAEAAYSTHLALAPDDQPIWVQYGHALKEQGKLADAEAAYRRAITLQSDDADAHLQLGHALKLRGDLEAARQSYVTSMELKPSKAALEEAAGLGNSEAAQQMIAASTSHDREGTIYLEVDDLLDYLRSHRTLSGIQRVQVGIIQHAISEGDERYAFVRTGKHAAGFWRLASDDLQTIIDHLRLVSVSQDRLLALIGIAEQRAVLVEPVRGQAYFVLGAFWGFGSNAARYARLKRAGVAVGVYIYDLIPVTHPEYCVAGLVSEFSFALADGLHAFDFVLTISEYVAKDVRKFLHKHGLRDIPVAAVPLAHQLHDGPPASGPGAWRGVLAPLRDRPFVLMVSTIEARKNHIYLYSVWKALIEEGLDPPDLVFVGRFGWRVRDLHDMLEGTGFLGGRIHVLHDLSDVDLELLYRSCLFTAFPSITEGWGLPVGESLAHGRPSVASSTSSIPEVGGNLVDYIDPWNVHDGIHVFRRMIVDEAYRAGRIQEIRDRFVARTWDDVGRDLLGRLAALGMTAPAPYAPPLLAAGEVLAPGELVIGRIVPANYAARPLRPIFAESWYPSEPIGAWMRGNEGSLWFLTDCKPGTRVTAYLHLIGAPWSVDHTVTPWIGRDADGPKAATLFPPSVQTQPETTKIKDGVDFLCRVSGLVDQDGTIAVHFRVKGEAVQAHPAKSAHDDRVFYFGLVKLAYAAAADVQLRVDLHERFSTLR